MRRWPAQRVFYTWGGALSLADSIIFTTIIVYWVQQVGMNPLQLVLLGTALELSFLFFEVPTGIVADVYSRKVSVIIGMLLMGVAYIAQGLLPFFAAVIGFEIMRGIGWTFRSGSIDAWLADEAGEDRVGEIYVRSGQIGRIVGLIGMALSAWIASIAPHLPLIVGGVIYFVTGLLLIVVMPEHNFEPRRGIDRSPLHAMARTFREGASVIRRSQTLILLFVANLFVGIASEGFDRLWEAHMLQNVAFPTLLNLQPVAWFAAIGIAGNIITFGITAVAQGRIEAITRHPVAIARAAIVLESIGILSIIALALAGSFWVAFVALMVKWIAASIAGPLTQTWVVNQIDARVRATALSMFGQTNALGQSAGGPAIGGLGLRSLRAALIVSAVLITPNLLVYSRFLRRRPVDAVVEQAAV